MGFTQSKLEILFEQKKDEKNFSFCGKRKEAKVVDVVSDGSFVIKFYHKNEIVQFPAKLFGIEVDNVQLFKDRVASLIFDKVVMVEMYDFDTDGKILVDLYINDILLHRLLIEEGIAFPK